MELLWWNFCVVRGENSYMGARDGRLLAYKHSMYSTLYTYTWIIWGSVITGLGEVVKRGRGEINSWDEKKADYWQICDFSWK